MTILFSLVLSLSAYFVLKRIKFFKSLSVLERLVLVLASSISVIGILLSYFEMFFHSAMKPLSIFIFILCLIFIIFSSKFILKDVLLIIRSIPKKGIYGLIFILLLVLVGKITIFYVLRPVIDPDVVSQYLTYARSIVISKSIPTYDLFTLSPVTLPPIGGPILFSFYYFISGNLQSEGFRLLTYPFLLGIVALTYLIAKKLFKSNLFSLLSCVVFLSFPVIDGLLLGWTLYPDIIAAFLELTIIYFLLFKHDDLNRKGGYILSVVLGLSAAEMLLLKSQSVLIFAMLSVLIMVNMRIGKYKTIILGTIFALILLFFPLTKLFNMSSFGAGNVNLTVYVLVTLPVFISFAFIIKSRNPIREIKPSYILMICSVMLLGILWLCRNYLLFGGFLTAVYVGFYKDMYIQYRIFLNGVSNVFGSINFQLFNGLALFALPVFGSILFIPKIVGVVLALFKKDWNLVVFFIFLWYALVIIYSGLPNERYLFGVYPFIGMIIVLGIKYLSEKIFSNVSKREIFSLVVVSMFSLFSLSQSIILSWGFGSLIFSPSQLRNIVLPSGNEVSERLVMSGTTVSSLIINKLILVVRLLNMNLGTFMQSDLIPSILLSLFASLIVLFLAIMVVKVFDIKRIRLVLISVALLMIAPYILLILIISGGNPHNFAKNEEKSLYSYWGEAGVIIPYFKNHYDNSSIVLVVGPQTGLSYKTFMKVYNIEYGYGFISVAQVVQEQNFQKVYEYFKNNDMQYVLVYEGSDNSIYLNNFKENSPLFNFINNSKYFDVEIVPDGNNLWRLYKLKNKV